MLDEIHTSTCLYICYKVYQQYYCILWPSVRRAAAHEQMFLRAVLSEFRRTGLEEATLGEIFTQLKALHRTEGHYTHTCTLAKIKVTRACKIQYSVVLMIEYI